MNTNITVRLHHAGRYWQARWTDPSGRRRGRGLGRRKDAGGSVTARQAEVLRRRLEYDLNAGRVAVGEVPRLGEVVARALELASGEVTAGTLALLDHTGRLLVEYFGQGRRLDRISAADAEDWRATVAKGGLSCQTKPPAKATVARHVREARRLLRLGGAPVACFESVVARAPRPARDWAVVSTADLEKILEACPSVGWRLLFALARLAGLRRGEALRLAWSDVDMDGRRLTVRPESGYETTKQRARQVPIVPRLHAVLFEAFMAERGGGGDAGELVIDPADLPKLTNNLWLAGRKIIRLAGLPIYAKPYHTLRKNCETDWLAKFPLHVVAEWLGHAPNIALQHYTRASAEDYRTAAAVPQSLPQSERVRS